MIASHCLTASMTLPSSSGKVPKTTKVDSQMFALRNPGYVRKYTLTVPKHTVCGKCRFHLKVCFVSINCLSILGRVAVYQSIYVDRLKILSSDMYYYIRLIIHNFANPYFFLSLLFAKLKAILTVICIQVFPVLWLLVCKDVERTWGLAPLIQARSDNRLLIAEPLEVHTHARTHTRIRIGTHTKLCLSQLLTLLMFLSLSVICP